MLADKATRSIGELADYADKLLIVRGINLPYNSTGCSHSAADAQILTAAEDHGGQHELQGHGDLGRHRDRRRQRTRPGATRSCSTRGCFRPAAPASTSPGTSRTSRRNSRACTSTRPTRRTRQIIGAVGNGTTVTSAEAQAQMQRAARSKSINDILRPQIQALLARTDLSTSDRARLDQHLTAIRDIEVKITTTTLHHPGRGRHDA